MEEAAEGKGDVETPEAMRLGLKAVWLTAYRNYRNLHVELESGFNVFAGPNAQGKTNLLEALYLLSTTRLLRGFRDAEAIMETETKALVEAELLHTRSRIGVALERGIRKRATLNGMNLSRAADLIGRLPCVCVSSADFPIVRGEPSDRRLFLDIELSQLHPGYLRHFTLYKRALEQRNALLKLSQERPQPDEMFESWEEQLAEHGASIRTMRQRYVDELRPHFERLHAFLGGGEALALSYMGRDPAMDADELLEAFKGNRRQETMRGTTQIGPHRDDLLIEIGGREARLYGSQGQQRTAVIALKMATLEHATEELGAAPLLLLDDILSDLDERRRGMLVELVLQQAGQTVLTCTEASAAGEDILRLAKVFEVEAGTVRER